MLGNSLGLGNRSAMDGFLFDDWWDKEAGPSEVPHFANGTGLLPNSTAYADLYGNWSLTQTGAIAAVRAAGGYTWSNVNCMLDPLYSLGQPGSAGDAGDGGLYPCGLTKTNGSPRANNKVTAPIWDGRKGNNPGKGETGKVGCAAWLREACSVDSVFSKIPTMLGFTDASTPRHPHSGAAFPAILQDIARFLLVRGPYSWMGYGWEGCITTPPPVVPYDHDYGEPLGLCQETAPNSGIFTRAWSKADVRMDCGTFVANITLKGTTPPTQLSSAAHATP